MKVCPKCGYVDDTHWRQNRWRHQIEFIPLTEFREAKPKLAMDLERGKPFVTDQYHAYRIAGKGKWIVERVWIVLYKVGGKSAFHIPMEKVKTHLVDQYQRKLIE